MIQTFEIKSKKQKGDVAAVEQIGYVDLRSAYMTGTIEGNTEGIEPKTNGIDDAASIMGRPDDIFAAYRMKEYIDSYGASKGAGTVSSQSPEGKSETV